jgi:hypothetical protein
VKTKLIVFLLVALVSLYARGENFLCFSIDATLVVSDPASVQEKILGWLKANNGYFIIRSDELLSVRFPVERLPEFSKFIESLGESIKDFRQESSDSREELLALQSGIKSREEMLSRNMSLFDRANVKDTLDIEKELIVLVQEIENLKGKLNKLENDRKTVFAKISFSFRKSSVPEKKVSSFGWINTLDFYKLEEEGFPGEK